MGPERFSAGQVVSGHALVLSALLLGQANGSDDGEARPARADRLLPENFRGPRRPIGFKIRSGQYAIAILTEILRKIIRRDFDHASGMGSNRCCREVFGRGGP